MRVTATDPFGKLSLTDDNETTAVTLGERLLRRHPEVEFEHGAPGRYPCVGTGMPTRESWERSSRQDP